MLRNRLPDYFKLAINQKNNHEITICRNGVIVNFFWCFPVSLVNFGFCSKFHVNIITGSGVKTILFYKGLTRNPEIGNTPVWVLPDMCRLGQVRDTKFRPNNSNEMLLNTAKFQRYNFYRFWVIKGKPVGGDKIILHHLD